MVSSPELKVLEDTLLNNSGNVPLHSRFRALFTLKALKTDEAIRIISKGNYCKMYRVWLSNLCLKQAFMIHLLY
jgi:hypothetical protein